MSQKRLSVLIILSIVKKILTELKYKNLISNIVTKKINFKFKYKKMPHLKLSP